MNDARTITRPRENYQELVACAFQTTYGWKCSVAPASQNAQPTLIGIPALRRARRRPPVEPINTGLGRTPARFSRQESLNRRRAKPIGA
jgi:hypothetical protein